MAAIQFQPSIEANRLQRLARLKKFDEVESALLAAIEANSMSLPDLFAVLEVVAEQNDSARTESVTWMVLTSWAERKEPEAAADAARRAAALLPQNDTIRSEITEIYRRAYSTRIAQTQTLLDMTFLRKNTPLAVAVQQMDKLVSLLPHTYVFDTLANAPGKLCGLNPDTKELIVAVGGQEKAYDATAALKLEPLADDDFRALAAFDGDRLRQLAHDNPEELIILVLRTFGPSLHFRDLKAQVTQIMSASAWSKWWADAKIRINRSALIEMSGGTQPTLTLRTRPLAYEDRVLRQFEDTESAEEKTAIILTFLRDHPPDGAPDSSGQKLLKVFVLFLQSSLRADEPALRLAAQAVLADMSTRFPDIATDPAAAAQVPEDPSLLLNSIFNDDVARTILEFIRRRNPDTWRDLYAAILPGAPIGISDWIVAELAQDGLPDSFANAVQSILHWPDRYPRAIVWLQKKATAQTPPDYAARIDPAAILTALLTAAQALKRKPPFADPEQQRRTLTQIKNALSDDNYALVRRVLDDANYDYAGYLRDTVPRNTGIGDAVASDIVKVLRETHPGLFVKNVPPWEEDAIYTTQAALDKRNQEFARLVNVDIAHNAKTIGDAAEKGDLRENAEFTAALEERDRLTERAARMRAELKKAKIIHPGTASTDSVSIGSAVRVQNLATGEEQTMVFLGPWDADPQRHIYSYLSPLALAFMGKKPGDTVTHESNAGQAQWKILEIAPGI